MAMRGPGSYRRSWGSDYSFEPINIFADKEKQRAGDLIKAASQQKYGTDMPPIPKSNFLSRALERPLGQIRDAVAQAGSMPSIPGTPAPSNNPLVRGYERRTGQTAPPVETGFKSAMGDVAHAANTLVSGRAFVKDLTKGAVDTNKLPWGLRQAADVVAAPLTLLTAGIGGAGAAAAKTGGQTTGKVLAGSILSRLARETAAGTAGYVASEQVDKRLPESTPGLVRAGVGLATGALAGGAAYKAIGNPGAAARVLKAPGSLEPLGATVAAEHPQYATYIETLGQHGIDARIGADGTIHVADRAVALAKAKELERAAAGVLEGSRVEGGPGIHFSHPFGSPERAAEDAQKAITHNAASITNGGAGKEGGAPRAAGPTVDVAALKNLDDAERIREIVNIGKVDPAKEALRTPFPEGSVLAGHDVLPPDQRTLLENAASNRSKGNATAGKEAAKTIGEDNAVQFVNGLMADGVNPRGIGMAIETEIKARGFTNGRANGGNNLTERAYRAKLTALSTEIDSHGLNAGRAPDATVGRATGANGPAGADAGAPSPTVKTVGLDGTVHDTGQTEAQINRPTQVDQPTPLPKPKAPVVQQGFGGSVQELPGMSGTPKPGLTPEAQALIDGGGVPFAVTNNLRRIATENGIDSANLSASEIMDALKGKTSPSVGTAPDMAAAARRRAAVGTATTPAEVRQPATGARGADAVPLTPSGVDTPASAPPMPPKEPPPPSEIGPGNPQRGFEQTGQPLDLLNARPRQTVIDEAATAGQTRVGRAKGRLVTRDPVAAATKSELDRTNHIVREFPAEQTDTLRMDAEKAGLDLQQRPDGWVVVGKDGQEASVSDMVEGRGATAKAVAASLTPEQNAVFARAAQVRDAVNRTAEGHGVNIAKVDTETGGFWPRKVIAREAQGRIIEKNSPTGAGGGSRSIGVKRGGRRTQASEAIGQEQSLIYDNPWTAFEDSLRNKLRMSQDAIITDIVKPLAVKDASGPATGYRPLRGNHPAFTTKQVVGTSEGGASIMVDKPMQFPNAIADQLDAVFNSNSITNTAPGRAVSAINSVATPLRAMADVSFFGNQGMGWITSSPQNAVKATKALYQTVRSALGDSERYAALRRTETTRTAELLTKAGVDEANQVGFLNRLGKHYAGEGAVYEQQFPTGFSKAIGKVPVVGKALEATARFSNETFGRFLNVARDTLANDALERAVGKGLKGAELEAEMKGAIKSTNRMTGWTNTKPSGIEELGFFAPRFFRSNIEQIVAAASKGDIEGQVARAHLLKLIGVGTGMTIAVNEMRGYSTDLDPRSTNFLRIRNLGGQDISPFGPFATLVRGMAQAAGGQPGEMSGDAKGHGFVVGTNTPAPDPIGATVGSHGILRSKASPVASAAWSLLSGSNYAGAKFDITTPGGLASGVAKTSLESIPFSAQALIKEGPVAALTSSAGVQGTSVTPAEKRDFERAAVTSRLFPGKQYADLLGTDKAMVNQDPKVMKLDAAAQDNALTKDNEQSKTTQFNQEYRAAVTGAGTFMAAGKDASGKPYTGVEYRHAVQTAGEALRNQMVGAGASGGGDPVLDGWYALYDKAKMADGSTNYDQLDVLQADYIAAHPAVQDKLLKSVGTKDDPTQQALRKAQAQAKQYYDIPKYRGLTAAEGEKADTAIAQATVLTTSNTAPNRAAAYQQLIKEGKLSEDDALLARRAPRLGKNPARTAFEVANPDFAVFYKGSAEGGIVAETSSSSGSKGLSKSLSLGSRGSSSKTSSRFRTAGGTRR